MMTIVFQKMEAYSGNFGVDIQTIQKNLDAKFNARKSKATRLQKDFGVTDLAVSSFFNDEDDSLEEKSREEPERVGTQINFSAMDQYLYMLCQNMVDNVCIYHKRAEKIEEDLEFYSNMESKEAEKNKERIDTLTDQLNNLSLHAVPKESKKKASYFHVDLPNEKGID